MEGINEHNFPEWFIAYHEGLLSPSDRKAVEHFLILNPQFAEDFEHLGEAYLKVPASKPSSDFAHLKKSVSNANDHESPDFLAARLAFGDMGQNTASLPSEIMEKAQVLAKMVLIPEESVFPDKHLLKIPENDVVPAFLNLAGSEGGNLSSLVLQPDKRVVLREKSLLTRSVPVRTISFKKVFYSAASIAAIMLLTAGLFFRNENAGSVQGLATRRIEAMKSDRTPAAIPTPAIEIAPDPLAVRVQPKKETEEEGNLASQQRMFAMAGISPKKASLRLLDEPALASPEGVAFAHDEAAESIGNAQASGNNGYISLSEFARRKISRKLVGEEHPEGGFTTALAGKAGERISEKTGKPVAIEVSKTEEGRNSFHLRYGQFAISRNTP